MLQIKKLGKNIISGILERQVKKLRKKHNFIVVAVVGSVGKTSTKLAIAEILKTQKSVRYQEGNYNDRVTVPLIFFGHENPNMFNIFAWLKIIRSNRKQIRRKHFYDVVVLELGTDGPGQLKGFAYIKPDIAVVTAVTPEHMEFFDSIDAVAEEELVVAKFSKNVVINVDDVSHKYIKNIKNAITYGLSSADYTAETSAKKTKQLINVSHGDLKINKEINLLGKQGAKIALAAVAVANELDLTQANIINGLGKLKAFSGRMNILEAINKSSIIDDTYNSSPAAVIAGLDVLYGMKASQKIAILGTMNELGNFSNDAHKEIGRYCDPKQLDIVVTIGKPAEEFTGKVAKQKGCEVHSFDSPYEAGDFVKTRLVKGTIVFAKGSQNQVFAEESIKVLLADSDDAKKLVRQSKYWLDIKESQFGRRS